MKMMKIWKKLSKNESSIIMNMKILPPHILVILCTFYSVGTQKFSSGSDYGIVTKAILRCWNMIFSSHHIIVHGIHFPMIAGHNGENALVCDAARNALGQARSGAQ
jgi:hypothetical protein